MDIKTIVDEAIGVCEDAKAEKILAFEVGGTSVLTDYYVICSGNSTTHVRAIVERLQKKFREAGVELRSREGTAGNEWIIIDYNDIVVHVFSAESRERYNIEALIDKSHLIYPDSSAAS